MAKKGFEDPQIKIKKLSEEDLAKVNGGCGEDYCSKNTLQNCELVTDEGCLIDHS